MYDDVNETFWSVESVLALLPAGCSHVHARSSIVDSIYNTFWSTDDVLLVEPSQHKGPRLNAKGRGTRAAYTHLQKLLGRAMQQDDSISALKRYFKKTYCE